ncbi:AhpC/TSA antioxidant enzyme-domain-containing protein [Microdochium bolleyi]|uniref:AhpC/TSA antioxidant enzyme-domain-containing protein n=1 Tax=Microdochium bolleyi TaxID=196109 RepID=A0A136J1I8_9PEZI|nr:AhpC/TSA antioxidant enzyme-domain-containing protein [Microdochium bolleyi]
MATPADATPAVVEHKDTQKAALSPASGGHDPTAAPAPAPATETAPAPSTTATGAATTAPASSGLQPPQATPAPESAKAPPAQQPPATNAPSNDAPVISSVTAPPPDDDNINPPDFQGEVATNNDLPTQEVLRKIQDYTVLDRHGRSHPFKSLYSGHNVARRVLVIFIRHFFCGNCQEYIRSLSPAITPETLLALPVSTFVVVIGCGTHQLIDSYIKETGCQFDVYADPTRRLYDKLGMIRTLNMGSRPAYMQNKSVAHTVVSGVMQGLKHLKSGLTMKMGDQRQVGGEFLFEPASMSLDTPITTPQSDKGHNPLEEAAVVAATQNNGDEDANDLMMNGSRSSKTGRQSVGHDEPSQHSIEEKRVTWCHRMKTTRDHAEIPELLEILGLSEDGTPKLRKPKDEARFGAALRSRKGTGISLASQMSRMSIEANAAAAHAYSANANGHENGNGVSNVKV